MKKAVLFLVFIFVVTSGFCQKNESFFNQSYGAKLGLNYQMMVGTPWLPEFRSGIVGGFFADLMRGKNGIRIEATIGQAYYKTEHNAAYFPEGHKGFTSAYDTIN